MDLGERKDLGEAEGSETAACLCSMREKSIFNETKSFKKCIQVLHLATLKSSCAYSLHC